MKKEGKNKKSSAILLSCAIAAGCLAIAASFLLKGTQSVEERFPFWLEPVEREVEAGIELRWSGLTPGEEYDELSVSIGNLTGREYGYGEMFYVEFLHDGEWHTVYMPEGAKLVEHGIGSGQWQGMTYHVPSGLLDVPGQYRIYVSDLGYCDVDLSRTGGKAP